MDMNKIGKFEMRKIVNEFDANLIELFGLNMSDAGITRHEAVSAYNQWQCARRAVEDSAGRRGLVPQAA
jgi:hypothetical protein